ncbi:hypothetical protein [Streptomyces cyaneofuscatus]|uniref:hypothetical protein n=1 Tax=Streptomyces cyaneofuscatus TaxID=66883 RepID=UPI0034360CAD
MPKLFRPRMSFRCRVARTSSRLAEHLDAAGNAASIVSVGDAYDNALMESTIGLFKTELIKPGRPWRTLSQVDSPPPSGSTVPATADSTVKSGTSHPPNTRPTTTAQPQTPGHNHNLTSPPNPERFSERFQLGH